MAWSPDPELLQMFLDELDERSSRLASGARALAAGDQGSVDVAAMRREGHTIKGTARVMGYEAIGSVGLMIEEIWDGIADGAIEATPSVGEVLAVLVSELESAGRENPQAGTTGLAAAAAAVHELVPTVAVPDIPGAEEPDGPPEPPEEGPGSPSPDRIAKEMRAREPEPVEDLDVVPPPVETDTPSVALTAEETESRPTSRRNAAGARQPPAESTGPGPGQPAAEMEPPELPVEYGGLIGAVDSWASEGTVIVNAGRLYRLINRIAATRAEAAALTEMVSPGATVSEGLHETAEGMLHATEVLQSDVLRLASLPLSTLTHALPQLVTYLSKKLGKNIRLEISGDRGVIIDRQVLEAVSESVRQLIVNSIYHGLEVPSLRKEKRKPNVGLITLDVALEDSMLELVIADDGAGVDWDLVRQAGIDWGLIDKAAPHDEEHLIPLLFEPGFTTGAIDGGRGNGLAHLAAAVEDLHGRVQFETWPGDGTRVTVRVPAWTALQRVLIVWAGGLRWAIPEAAVERTMSTAEAGVGTIDGVGQIDWEGRLLPLRSFARAAGVDPGGDESFLIVLSHRIGTAALAVASIEGRLEVAVTELAPLAAGPEHVAGVALLGAGEVALVIDVGRLVERTRTVPGESRSRARVLVVDDSAGGRAVLSGSLSASGFSTSVAGSVAQALDVLAELAIDALVVDFSLPTTSGIALVEAVRRRDRRMPIVMISAVASPDDKVRAKMAGIDRFFDKSDFREGALATALWDLLEE